MFRSGAVMMPAVVLAMMLTVSPGAAKEVTLQSFEATPICRNASDLRGAVLAYKYPDDKEIQKYYGGKSPLCVRVKSGEMVKAVGKTVNRSLHVKTKAGFVGWADDFMFDVP